MGDLSGTTMGEYQLVRKLGEGGMATVYLGRHPVLDQLVAVKVLNPFIAVNRELRERFIQEAKIQVSLRHPNIVQVFTAITTGPHLALIMEYVDGRSLDVVLKQRGALPVSDSMYIAKQVLSALEYAHRKGVVHRDIKPSNIMIRANGIARVMDFGIAKVMGDTQLTRTGTVMGSAPYMSPEQVVNQTDITHHSDIYSMGITLFEMLAGRLPFNLNVGNQADSDYLIKHAHMNETPIKLTRVSPDAPRWLSGALHKALAKAPGQRHRDCLAFLRALKQVATSDSTSAGPNDTNPLFSAPFEAPQNSRMTGDCTT